MSKLVQRVRRPGRRRDDGATAAEYGLLIALVAVVLAAGAFALGTALNNRLDDAADCVNTPASDCNPGPATT